MVISCNPYKKFCACNIQVTCIIQVMTCTNLGAYRFHLYLRACSTHVSCNIHGFGMFSMQATRMLHDMHVICVKQLGLKIISQSAHPCIHIHVHLRI